MPETPGSADPVGRFSDRAAHYAAHRPGYPAAAIEGMLRGLGWPAMLTVADVGAGTGIVARMIADLGPMVVALEPNAAMRGAAEPHERVVWHDGTAEATGLNEGSLNLLVCAQAFHWFDRAAALAEFRRVLRATGRLVLMWNEVDTDDPLAAGYRRIVDDAATDDAPRRRHAAQERPFAGDELFADVTHAAYPYEQILTAEGLLGRAMSASYAPKTGPAHEAMAQALRALHAEHASKDGTASLRYVTSVWTASVRGDDPLVRVAE